MRIGIFGLGYVGMVNAVCLAQAGHDVFGVDVNRQKVHLVNAGHSPITEACVEELLREQVRAERFYATEEPTEAIAKTDISFICVGTPSTAHGHVDLSQVEKVCRQVGTALQSSPSPHTVVLRSTMLPGSCQRMARLLTDVSGRTLGQDLHIAYNPEFLREGTAVNDFYTPPYTILGTEAAQTAAIMQELYSFLSAPFFQVQIAEAELLKYACNAFHATKITFANEIGRLARSCGINGARVMELLCQDGVLNISTAYLRPGFAYGGSCLPKDVRAIVGQARLHNVDVPLLESLSWSNRLQIDHAYEVIAQAAHSKKDTIGVLGLTFKAGTDDLRESPMVELVERLFGKGYRLLIYDEHLSLTRLMGSNKAFIYHELPHLTDLLAEDAHHVVEASRILVVLNLHGPYADALRTADPQTSIIDLEQVLSRPVAPPHQHIPGLSEKE